MREARDWVTKFIYGNSSPLLEYDKPSADALAKAGYGFYAAGIMEQLAEVPFEQLVEEDYVWVGTPDEIVERIEETQEDLPRDHRDRRSPSTPAARRTGWRSRTRSSSPRRSITARPRAAPTEVAQVA